MKGTGKLQPLPLATCALHGYKSLSLPLLVLPASTTAPGSILTLMPPGRSLTPWRKTNNFLYLLYWLLVNLAFSWLGYINTPASEFRSQARILSIFTDSERQLLLGNSY